MEYIIIFSFIVIVSVIISIKKNKSDKRKKEEQLVTRNKITLEITNIFSTNMVNIEDTLLIWSSFGNHLNLAIAYDKINKSICLADHNKQIVTINSNEILKCELRTNSTNINKGEIKKTGVIPRAIVGGVIAGEIGAVVGGLSTKENITTTTESIVSLYYIDIYTSNSSMSFFTLSHRSGVLMKKWYGYILHLLNNNEVDLLKVNSSNLNSSADELIKLKGLLDSNIINQEEFDNEKRKILNRD